MGGPERRQRRDEVLEEMERKMTVFVGPIPWVYRVAGSRVRSDNGEGV